MEAKRIKKYVQVTADFFTDGRKFRIDKIKDIRRAASLKAGGTGIRYTCLVWGKECYLFYEENYKWFVEEKVAA